MVPSTMVEPYQSHRSGEVAHGATGVADPIYAQGLRTPVRLRLNWAPLNPRAASLAQNFAGFRWYSALNTALWPTYELSRLHDFYWLHCSVRTASASGSMSAA